MMLAQYGGLSGVRDEGLLESALAKPQNHFAYQSPALSRMAASYAAGIIHNHPFLDGNKRAGHAAMETFLVLNGFEVEASVEDQERILLDVAAGRLDRDQFAEWLSDHVRPAV